MQYEIIFKGDGWCSCYTCLPQTVPAAQTALKTVAAPGTGTGAPQMDQRRAWKRAEMRHRGESTVRSCNTRFIKGHKPRNHIRARIKSHVYTTE